MCVASVAGGLYTIASADFAIASPSVTSASTTSTGEAAYASSTALGSGYQLGLPACTVPKR